MSRVLALFVTLVAATMLTGCATVHGFSDQERDTAVSVMNYLGNADVKKTEAYEGASLSGLDVTHGIGSRDSLFTKGTLIEYMKSLQDHIAHLPPVPADLAVAGFGVDPTTFSFVCKQLTLNGNGGPDPLGEQVGDAYVSALQELTGTENSCYWSVDYWIDGNSERRPRFYGSVSAVPSEDRVYYGFTIQGVP